MRRIKVVVLAVVMILLVSALAACNAPALKYGTEYSQYFYNSEEQKFMATGNTITIGDQGVENYKYVEKFYMGDARTEDFAGSYVRDDKIDLMFMVLNSSSFEKFKRTYRNTLKDQGYTRSEIDNIIMPSLSDTSEMFRYKDYLFKGSAIVAAKIEDPAYRLNELDGYYKFTGLLGERESVMKLERNNIYLKGVDETGEPIYTQQIGVCELNNDIITIEPQVALEGGKPSDSMKYLIADIELPAKYAEKVDEDGSYEGNSVITYYANVKVRVIVSSFYTAKEIKL